MLNWVKNHRWQMIVVILWMLLILGINRYMAAHDLTFTGFLEELDAVFSQWYGPLIYIAIYFLRPVVFFPASLLTILAGSIWGLGLGFVFGLIAGTLSSLLPYVFGRWFAVAEDATLQPWITRFTGMIRTHPFQAVLTIRLLYLPYDTASFVIGILRVSFVPFILATAMGNIIGTLSFVGIGASLEGDITEGNVSLNPAVLIFSFLLLIVSIGITRYLRKGSVVDV